MAPYSYPNFSVELNLNSFTKLKVAKKKLFCLITEFILVTKFMSFWQSSNTFDSFPNYIHCLQCCHLCAES